MTVALVFAFAIEFGFAVEIYMWTQAGWYGRLAIWLGMAAIVANNLGML